MTHSFVQSTDFKEIFDYSNNSNAKLGKKFILKYLSEDCQILLNNASKIIDVNQWEDSNCKILPEKAK